MRLGQVFKRPLGMQRERVVGVEIAERIEGAVVQIEVALRARRALVRAGDSDVPLGLRGRASSGGAAYPASRE